MIKMCRHTWGFIQEDKGVSSYIRIYTKRIMCVVMHGDVYKMIKVCRHVWVLYKMIKRCRHTWDLYKIIKVYHHTWGCIQDDKGVSPYM